MPIIVQKFGGSSVADAEKILAAARKAVRAQAEGDQVVMVLSAMGDDTDRLIGLARRIAEEPPARELDMLLATGEQVTVALMAMAIHSLGHKAISMTGAQIGILTDSIHTKARIHSISTDRIHKALDAGNIVIAAGFQGIDESGNITTLGRGGSDTTAVALAAVLKADACEIYTDVDGIYTTDPRLMPEARLIKQISYDEMLELASAGANVMHNRSIEFAKKFDVPVHVRGSFTDAPGTLIGRDPESPDAAVCGAALARNEARVTVLGVPDRPGAALTIFSKVASRNIAIDMIVQNEAADSRTDFSFTVLRDDLPGTLRAVGEAAKELGAEGCDCDDDVSKISIVGLGMATRPGRRRHHVPRLGRKGDQHPDDYHQRDQDLGGGGPGTCPRGPARGPCGVSTPGRARGGRRTGGRGDGRRRPARRGPIGRRPATHGKADYRTDRPRRVAGPGDFRRPGRHPRPGGANLR